MKLPDALNKFIHKPSRKEEAYLSLVLEAAAIQAAAWILLPGKKPHISEAVSEPVGADSWEKRLESCDRAIAKLAQKEGRDDFEKVVLGLPAYYLTAEDDIEHAVRTHIKTITEELELAPIGFVPIHQAIVHMIKQEEGVPPSVILLEVGPGKTTMILYKVGAVVGRVSIGSDDLVLELERALKGFKELEVLPSRVLLYGGSEDSLESYKRDLLKHPWPTRANFLHYPKIEVLPQLTLAGAVSLAGASELASVVAKPDENVVEVTSDVLGFRRDVDILEHPVVEEPSFAQTSEGKKNKKEELKETLMRFVSTVKLVRLRTVALPKTGILALLIVALLIGAGGWITYWVLPRALVTVYQVPQMVAASSAVTVNSTATVVDAATKTVPGRKQEKTVSGEKTIAVTGQKDIGDPARGTVTVYNKSFSTRMFKKGTIIATGSLQFTLDSDITVASKSVNLSRGEETYGQASASVTAVTLGPNGNIPAGKEFSFRDFSSDIASAWNEKAFSGGTSKVVTVVSRADYDSLITALTKDLIEKAKSELATSVAGKERLIDETVKTSVTEKKFDAELGQEAKKLHGTITITISGISYSDADIASLFGDLVATNVPAGYTLRDSGVRVNATNVKLQKDGSISLDVEYQGQALPTFDLPALKSKLAGKSIAQAQEELKAVTGVGGVAIDISRSFWKKKLPASANNIALSVAVLE